MLLRDIPNLSKVGDWHSWRYLLLGTFACEMRVWHLIRCHWSCPKSLGKRRRSQNRVSRDIREMDSFSFLGIFSEKRPVSPLRQKMLWHLFHPFCWRTDIFMVAFQHQLDTDRLPRKFWALSWGANARQLTSQRPIRRCSCIDTVGLTYWPSGTVFLPCCQYLHSGLRN